MENKNGKLLKRMKYELIHISIKYDIFQLNMTYFN